MPQLLGPQSQITLEKFDIPIGISLTIIVVDLYGAYATNAAIVVSPCPKTVETTSLALDYLEYFSNKKLL